MPKFKLIVSHGITQKEAGWKEMTWKHIPREGESMSLDSSGELEAEVTDVNYSRGGKITVKASIPYDRMEQSAFGGYDSGPDDARVRKLKRLGYHAAPKQIA